MDPSLLSRIERGEVADVGLSKAVALCAVYGITVEQLVGPQSGRAKPAGAKAGRRTAKAKRLLAAALAEIESIEEEF